MFFGKSGFQTPGLARCGGGEYVSGTPIWTRTDKKRFWDTPSKTKLESMLEICWDTHHNTANTLIRLNNVSPARHRVLIRNRFDAGMELVVRVAIRLIWSGKGTIGTPKIFTTTGFGPRQNKKMARRPFLGVYANWRKYRSLYIHHPTGAACPRGGVYRKCCVFQ